MRKLLISLAAVLSTLLVVGQANADIFIDQQKLLDVAPSTSGINQDVINDFRGFDMDSKGDMYIADPISNSIWYVTPDGTWTEYFDTSPNPPISIWPFTVEHLENTGKVYFYSLDGWTLRIDDGSMTGIDSPKHSQSPYFKSATGDLNEKLLLGSFTDDENTIYARDNFRGVWRLDGDHWTLVHYFPNYVRSILIHNGKLFYAYDEYKRASVTPQFGYIDLKTGAVTPLSSDGISGQILDIGKYGVMYNAWATNTWKRYTDDGQLKSDVTWWQMPKTADVHALGASAPDYRYYNGKLVESTYDRSIGIRLWTRDIIERNPVTPVKKTIKSNSRRANW